MGSKLSSLAYSDIRTILDRALENGRGVLIRCDTHGQAAHLRQRCYEWRLRDRELNAKTYPDIQDPRHASSVYDRLIFTPANTEEGPVLQIVVASPERLEERIVEL